MSDHRATVLFLCTGNYYRSRFAECYFRHLSDKHQLPWLADSRGLQVPSDNDGPLSPDTITECGRLNISVEPLRFPLPLTVQDLERANLTIAMQETEHRALLRAAFPDWEARIDYWEIHDRDVTPPQKALPQLRRQVEALVGRLQREQA